MCGICGIHDLAGRPVDRGTLERMAAVIQHRGPDGSGLLVDAEIGMAHRRLSIIDIDGGAQPIGNEDGMVQVVFNGEIYNFVELRRELEGLGHKFATRTDTEVIVHAYEQWGRDCVDRFNGMFSFALFDAKERTLFLARDHLGIKPLYFTRVGTRLVFASEIKALFEVPDVRRDVDIDALAELFTFRYVPSPKTLFAGIYKLPPGHWMASGPRGVEVQRYWRWVPKAHVSPQRREDDLVEEYQDLFESAVRMQMRSDVPVGLFLSSGVDSGALLALMSEIGGQPVHTFTIGFEGGERSNELADAAAVARRFGASHHERTLGVADYQSYFDRYMSDLEEPVAHEPAPAFYYLSQLARGQVKVALTGQGADEPWAGYHRYVGVKLSSLYSRLPSFVTRPVAPLVTAIPLPMERIKRGVVSLAEPDVLTRFTKIYSFFDAETKARLYRGELRSRFERSRYGTKEALRRLQSDVSHLDPLSQMLYIDTRANLPDDLLMVADKTSMANSLEVRVPFLDRRVVEFIESLPPELKLRGITGKYLHKRAMTKWLPRESVYRKKKGFAHPIAQWLRGPMQPLVEDCLLSADSHLTRYFDPVGLAEMVQRHRRGTESYMRHIYLLVSLELWHRAWFGSKSTAVRVA